MASDLHTHTNYSDGSYSPEELLAAAKKLKLNYLGITDHDTVDGIIHLYESGLYPNKGIRIIPGSEFSVNNPEHDVHLVGYNIDIYNGALQDKLNDVIEARWSRFNDIMIKLQDSGFAIREADVLKVAGTSKSIGRLHIARALVKAGCFDSIREAFDKMLRKGSPAYVPRYLLELDEVVNLIHKSGGTAVLAHPKLIGDDDLVEKICAEGGIDALEVFYPLQDAQDTERYTKMAETYGLKITGGSDFHGTTSRYVKELGEFTIADEIAEKFYQPLK